VEEQKIEEDCCNENIDLCQQNINNKINGQQQQKPLKFLASFLFIFSIATSWALATQFRKSVMVIDKKHVFAPFFMVWFGTCFMFFCYPLFIFYFICLKRNKKLLKEEHLKALQILKFQQKFKKRIGHLIILLILWTCSNYLYARALIKISASTATSIMSTNSAIVYLLEWILLGENFSSTALAISGVVIISFDSEFFGNNLTGIILVILSALFASFYKVFFKLILKNLFEVFNSLVNFGIVILGPLIVSIGMIFGIPLSTVIDILFNSISINYLFIIGSIFILISFILIILPQIEQKFNKSKCCCIKLVKEKEEN
uniref:EamA domain-containing protein n=1 Tax=Meloidogyne floridensis TaxID=298350 RepID=A0A915NTU1_9BILA